MVVVVHPYSQLGHVNHGWLRACHHFSFASYQNPERMGFGCLRVINDDTIAAGSGFELHGHQDMEIITYVRQGAITHRDNQGNEGRTEAGDVQVMSAGTGILHSEYNLEATETKLFQIWIEPNQLGVEPRWDAHEFPKAPSKNGLTLLVSGDGQAPLFINQHAFIYAGRLTQGSVVKYMLHQQAYLLVAEGTLEVQGQCASQGDGVEISGIDAIELRAVTDVDVIVIDVPNGKLN